MIPLYICNLNEEIELIRKLIERYSERLLELDNQYGQMLREAQDSLEESRNYWESFASDEISNSGHNAARTIEYIEEQISHMEDIINELASYDKAFLNYKNKYKAQNISTILAIEEETDFLIIVKEKYDQLRSTANECSRTIKSFPFQSLELTFSKKRKGKYAKILEYYDEVEQIANKACEVLPRKTESYWNAVAAGRDEEIEKAIQETSVLMAAIIDEREKEQNTLIKSFEIDLDKILPAEKLLHIIDYFLSDNVEKNSVSERFNQVVPVGYYAQNVCGRCEENLIVEVFNRKMSQLMADRLLLMPAVFDLNTANNFGIRNTSSNQETNGKEFVLSLINSLLINVPVGNQKFTLIDPEGRSKGFKPILDFISNTPEVMGNSILTTQEQIYGALSGVNNYIDTAAQNHFVGYENIYEYNVSVSEKPEAYRTIVIMDFPKYFNENMLDNLWNIVNEGSCYGVGVILQYNDNFIENQASEKYYSLLNKINEKVILFEEVSGGWFTSNGVSVIPNEFNINKFNEFSKKFREVYTSRKKQGIPLDKIIDAQSIGVGNSVDCLSIPFGINDLGNVQYLEFGDIIASGISHYALVTGSLGSGKSTLLHTIVMSAITKYSPDEINIYLMDFKKGTEFKIYSEKKVPHIKLLAMDAMQEFGQSILKKLCDEMSERATLFKDASVQFETDIRSISQYRNITGRKMPRLLVIADEFQVLFDGDANRKVANSCGKMMADLISLARVYGIHFVFATQTLSRINNGNFTIQKSSLNEMHVKIGLKGSEAEAELLFGARNGAVAYNKYGEEKGLGAYIADDTSGVPNGFRCAYCSQEMQRELLTQIAELYSDYQINTRVFAGTLVSDISEAKEYDDYNSQIILLGEPIMTGENLYIKVDNRKKTNLLVVGNSESLSSQIVELYLISIKKFFNERTKLYYFDGELIVGDEISKSTKKMLDNITDCTVVDNEDQIIPLFENIYNIYADRKNKGKGNVQSNVFIIIKHIQWIDVLNRIFLGQQVEVNNVNIINEFSNDELFSFVPFEEEVHENDLTDLFDSFEQEISNQYINETGTGANIRAKILELISYGYMYGIHFVLTANDYTSVKDYMYDVISKFNERVIFDLNDNDADRFIPEMKVQTLPDNIAVYTNGINKTYQFKPFTYLNE